MKVYNPDDEPVKYRFAGSPEKELAPNAKSILPDNEARFLQEAFGKFGVTIIPEGADEKALVEDAERRYLRGTRDWAVTVLSEWWERTKTQRELGIKVEEPEDVMKARAWMKAKGFM